MLQLTNEAPFAKGGNRLCFIHPLYSDRCIKVRRPDFTLEQLRKKKGFPKNLKPLSSFDDNLEEYNVIESLKKHAGDSIFQVISQYFGFEETDMGRGLVSSLVRDESGSISHTLKQVIWDEGYTQNCKDAVSTFSDYWIELSLPSRDLLLHNIVAQRGIDGTINRLYVIDGLGSPNIMPYWWLPKNAQRKKAMRRINNLHTRIESLISLRGSKNFPGYHGQLLHDGLPSTQNCKSEI